jgi:hypothetical protein
MRAVAFVLIVGILATACDQAVGWHPATASSSATATSATATTRSVPSTLVATPGASPTASPSGGTPISLGAVPEAGLLYVWGADDGIYRYDGATGALSRVWGASTLARETAYGPYVLGRHGGLTLLRWDGATEPKCPSGSFADLSIRGTCAFIGAGGDTAVYLDSGSGARMLLPADWGAATFAWSPDGAELAIIRNERRPDPVPQYEPRWRNTLWHLDRHGALTKIFDSNSPTSFLFGLKWSFDRRLSLWESTTNSNSLAADGAGTSLHVVNVDTRASVDLGTTLGKRAWAQWSLDGRLAFVSGGGRETWGNKQLLVLERDGTRRVVAGALGSTSDGESAAIAPAWQPIFGSPARLAWIEGPAASIGASSDYFRGIGPVSQRIAVLQTSSSPLRLTCPGLITEGVRWSSDASAALLLCRVPGIATNALQLWYVPLQGTARPILAGLGDLGFGYYGAQPSLFDIVAWSLADR